MLVGGEELKWHQPAHHQVMTQPRNFSPHSTMIKHKYQEQWLSSGISDVAFASVYSEKNRLKKLMMIKIIIIIIIKS